MQVDDPKPADRVDCDAVKTEEGWIMLKLDASKSGSVRIGGEVEVNRLGFGLGSARR